MGIPMPSYLFYESPEPPKSPLPLEARRIHFRWCPSQISRRTITGHPHAEAGRWDIPNPDGDVFMTDYAYRYNLLRGGHRMLTHAQAGLDGRVRSRIECMLRARKELVGSWPVVHNYRGRGHSFDVFFVQINSFGCTNEIKVPEGVPEPERERSQSQAGTGMWDPLPEPAIAWWNAQPQEDEASETVLASGEESVDNGDSDFGDTTSENDSDYVPPTAHTQSEATGQRSERSRYRAETLAMMRQMRRFAEEQHRVAEAQHTFGL